MQKHLNLKSLATGLCAVALFMGMLSVTQAGIVAFNPPVMTSFTAEPVGNDGMFFTPNVAISVTHLGYAAPGDGGNPVGLYRVSDSALLASTTVYSTSPQSGAWLWEPITPVALTAGVPYAVVGFFTGNGEIGYNATSGVGEAADITFNGYKYDLNLSLGLPTIGYNPPIFGPNFQYVPEPSSFVLCGLSLIGLVGIRRRSK